MQSYTSLAHPLTLHGFLFPQLISPPYLYSSFAFSSPVCHPPPLSLLKFLHFSAPYFLGGRNCGKRGKRKLYILALTTFFFHSYFFSLSREFTPRTDATNSQCSFQRPLILPGQEKEKDFFLFSWGNTVCLSVCL